MRKRLRHLLLFTGIFTCALIVASFLPAMFRALIPLVYPPVVMVDFEVKGPAILGIFYLAMPVFVFLTFVIFFVKEWRHRFSRPFPTKVTFVNGFCLLVFLQILSHSLVNFRHIFSFDGWNASSASGSFSKGQSTMLPAAEIIFDYVPFAVVFLQLVVTICLVIVAYRFGQSRVRRSFIQADI